MFNRFRYQTRRKARSVSSSIDGLGRGIGSAAVCAAIIALTSHGAAAQQPEQNLSGNCNDVSMVTIAPSSVLGSSASTGTVTLRKAARPGGLQVQLASDDSLAVTVPTQINVPAGAVTAQFPIQTAPVAADTHVFISAFCGNDRKHAARYQISVRPPRLVAIEIPKSLRPGAAAVGKVILTGPAPSAGFTVELMKGADLATPASVVVPAGQLEALFEIHAEKLVGQRTAGVTGRAGGAVIPSTTMIDPDASPPSIPVLSAPRVASTPPLTHTLQANTPTVALVTAIASGVGPTSATAVAPATALGDPCYPIATLTDEKFVTAVDPKTAAASADINSATLATPATPGATDLQPLLSNPRNFEAVAVAPANVRLSWAPVDGVKCYSVEGPGILQPSKLSATAFEVAGAPAGTLTYRLWSHNEQGVPVNPDNPSTAVVTVESRQALVDRAFAYGQPLYGVGGHPIPELWKQAALATDFGWDELVQSFQAIWVVAYAYPHLLGRSPDQAGALHYIEKLNAGTPWTTVWLEIAHSAEREQKFGYWAPAPIGTVTEARSIFKNSVVHPETCFGGLGDQCDTDSVGHGEWNNIFVLPDQTIMGYVDIYVAVGSILHDNACIASEGTGLYCKDEDLAAFVMLDILSTVNPAAIAIKAGMPAFIEWNKAVWNHVEGRVWRAGFGPYPTNKDLRRQLTNGWYDDVRPVPSRVAYMAPVLGVVTAPVQTVLYTGTETRQSRQLAAPSDPETGLDYRDQEFCRTGQFKSTFATWGVCR
jgi:hypothetical protein